LKRPVIVLSFFLVSLTGFSHSALASVAGLFIEPGMTFEGSDGSANFSLPIGSTAVGLKAFGVMARVGFHINEIVFVAADGRYSRGSFKLNGNGGYESTTHSHNWGITAGAQMPIAGARLWASYIAGGMIDPNPSNQLDVKFSGATGWRIGVGFHILSISLNFEYQKMGYGNLEVQQFGPFTNATVFDGTELTNKSYIMSITFPVEI
jgi:hypothetical protein